MTNGAIQYIRRPVLWLAVCLLLGGWNGSIAVAADQRRDFLEGLRDRGYHDVALTYLEGLASDPQCPEDLKLVLDYEAGRTLLELARSTQSPEVRQRQLRDSVRRFKKFLADNKEHPLATDARLQLAAAQSELGRARVQASGEKPAEGPPAEFAAAEQTLLEVERALSATLQSLGEASDAEEPEASDRRQQAERDLLQARLGLAGLVYESAEALPPDAPERPKRLEEAARRYDAIYAQYAAKPVKPRAAFIARLQQARIGAELGQVDEAIRVLVEMDQSLPDSPPAFADLKEDALGLLMEVYLRPDANKPGEALLAIAQWLETPAANEPVPRTLKIRFLAAQAAMAKARTQENADEAQRLLKTARGHFEFVRRFPGEQRMQAADILSKPPFGAASVDQQPDPKTFAEAEEQGNNAWETMIAALAQLPRATAEARDGLNAQANQSRSDALRYYRAALTLRTPEQALDSINAIRFRLSYLYWALDEFEKAAVLGEFVARRYPQHPDAYKAAEVAVTAYRSLYIERARAKGDVSFARNRMAPLVDLITRTWAGVPGAQNSRMMLIDTAAEERDLPTVLEHLEKIPADSSVRAAAELRAGQAIWAAYVRAANLEGPDRPEGPALDQMAKQAQQTIEQGLQRSLKAIDARGVDYGVLVAALSLAHSYASTGQPEKAVEWLDHPKVGPVTLVKAKHPATQEPGFAAETYKAALRAYVGAQQLEKAEAAMDDLEKLIAASGDADAVRKLTQEYVRLGRELQETLRRLRNENKAAEASRVAQGFEVFLRRVKQRQENVNFTALNWVGETFLGLGAGVDPGGKEPPAEAVNYYKQAYDTYAEILKRMKDDPQFAPSGVDTALKLRVAECLRGLNKHDRSMELLAAILRQNERRVDIQITAAETYQDWGEQEPAYFEKAISGGMPENGRNLVWGWAGIARRVAPQMGPDAKGARYSDTFHQARYNLAASRVKLAMTERGDRKLATLRQAKRDITAIYRLYPELGGPEWYARYDSLLKTIQKLLGEKAEGLEAEAAVKPVSTARAAPSKS